MVTSIKGCFAILAASYVGAFPVSRETELYEGAKERSSLMLFMKRCYADLNHPLARLLASAEILAQRRENLLVN
jgi:hypothetical protein